MDDLLKLIEKGQIDELLLDEELRQKLNLLIKYELVIVQGDSLILSQKGKEATKLGVEKTLKQIRFKHLTEELPFQKNKKLFVKHKKDSWLIGFLIILTFFALFLILPIVI